MNRLSRISAVAATAAALVLGATPMVGAAEGNPYNGSAYAFASEGTVATAFTPVGYHRAQPFVASLGGSLATATVDVVNVAAGTTVSATIYEDSGFPAVGAVVASDTVAVGAEGTATFTFESGALVKGGAYVFRFSVDSGSVLLIVDSDPGELAPNYWGYNPGVNYWGESVGFSIVGQVNVSGSDADAPTVTGALTPADPDGLDGWYVSSPTVAFDCADTTTVVVDCPEGGLIQDGEFALERTVTDLAGNTGSMTPLGVKVDTVAPTLAFVPSSEPNTFGWYKKPVSVDLSTSDATSGVAAGPTPGTLDRTTAVEWTVSDNAGNSSTKTQTFKVDTRAPSVKIPGLEAGEVFGTKPNLSCKASDGVGKSASGVVSCRTTVDKLRGSKYVATAMAKDKAGNRAEVSVKFVVR